MATVAKEGGEFFSIGAQGHGGDPSCGLSLGDVGVDRSEEFALLGVPEANFVVIGGREEGLSIGGEDDGVDDIVVIGEGAQQRSGLGLPEAGGAIIGGRGNELAIGGEGDRVDPFFVAKEDVPQGKAIERCAGLPGPEEDRAIRTPRDKACPCGIKGDALEGPCVDLKGLVWGAGGGPEADPPVGCGGEEEVAIGVKGEADYVVFVSQEAGLTEGTRALAADLANAAGLVAGAAVIGVVLKVAAASVTADLTCLAGDSATTAMMGILSCVGAGALAAGVMRLTFLVAGAAVVDIAA